MNDELGPDFARVAVTEVDHLPELIAGVDVEQRERNLAGIEGLLGEAQHDAGVLANGIEHDGPRKLSDGFAENVQAFGLEGLKVVEPLAMQMVNVRLNFARRSRQGCLRRKVGDSRRCRFSPQMRSRSNIGIRRIWVVGDAQRVDPARKEGSVNNNSRNAGEDGACPSWC